MRGTQHRRDLSQFSVSSVRRDGCTDTGIHRVARAPLGGPADRSAILLGCDAAELL